MIDLVNTILESSQAKLIIDKVQKKLVEEQRKRKEFYAIIDEDTKAEFVNGDIIYHSPVKKEHNDAAMLIVTLLKPFAMLRNLGYVGFDKIMISLTRNDYEPNVCFFNQTKAKKFVKGQMHFPVPDLAVEVLSSNEKHDRETKFNDYQDHGVEEYWIIDADKEILEQYILKNGSYELNLKASEGRVTSVAVKGFKIPIKAIFDEQENLKTLRKLLQ